jgi:hypothetical protein
LIAGSERSTESCSSNADIEESSQATTTFKTELTEHEVEFLKQKEQPKPEPKKPVSSGNIFKDTKLACKHFNSLLGRVQHEILNEDRYDLYGILHESLADFIRLLAETEIKTKEMKKRLSKVNEEIPDMPEMDNEGNYVSG